MVNAVKDTTSSLHNIQGAIPLVSMLPDGHFIVAPAIMKALAPALGVSLPIQNDNAEVVSEVTDTQIENHKYVNARNEAPRFKDNKKNFFIQGITWSSMMRRLKRKNGSLSDQEAFRIVADQVNHNVTDVKLFIQNANKKTKVRLKAIRQALAWQYFLEGKTHREIASQFPFYVHYKTIENDIKDMKATLSRGGFNA